MGINFPLQELASILYYIGAIIGAVFVAGWWLNSRLKNVVDENNTKVIATMAEINNRVIKLETESVRVIQHDKDMTMMYNLINSLKESVVTGFSDMSKRIDTLLLATNRGA